MNKIFKNIFVFCLVFCFYILFSDANAKEWGGYVIKMTDYAKYKGDNRIPFMIFPQNKTYRSESICYSEFGEFFKYDDEMIR